MSNNPLRDIILETTKLYCEHVDKRTREIPEGTFLCVHDSIKTDAGNDWRMTYEITSHILQTLDEVCDHNTRRMSVFARKA